MRSTALALTLALCVVPSSAHADERGLRVEATGLGYNAAQHFALRFDDASASVQPVHGDPLVLQTVGVGRGTSQRFLSPGRRSVHGEGVTLSRPWLDEWFQNTEAGLEHGWSLPSDPLPGEGPLELRVDVSGGRTPVLVAPDEVRFLDRTGVTPFHYTHPAAFDATGAALRVELDVDHGQVVVRVYDAGAQYPLCVDPLIWGETNALTEPGPGMLQEFGYMVDLDDAGNRLAVSARGNESEPGRVYLFVRTGARWVFEAMLRSPEASPRDGFGETLEMGADLLVVGAPRADTAAGTDAGAAYVFVRGAAGWAHAASLGPPGPFPDGRFGASLAMDGDQVVVLACLRPGTDPGELFFFDGSSGMWSPDGRLTMSNADRRACVPDPHNLSMSSGRVAWGASQQRVEGAVASDLGGLFIIERRDGAWSETAFVRPTSPVPSHFGDAVALVGDRLVVGAQGYWPNMLPDNRGYVFVYERRGDAWVEADVLRAPPSPSLDFYGMDVFAWDDRLAVGAYSYDWPDGVTLGAVFVYRFGATDAPTVEAVLSPPLGMRLLGRSLTAVGDTIVAATPVTDPPVMGIVRVFELRLEQGDPCGADADCLSGYCTDGVCCDVACGGGDPTDCQVCSFAEGGAADGLCSPAPAGGTCRPALGDCDVADLCDGTSPDCADAVSSSGGVCRAAMGPCDAEDACDGVAPTCPADEFLGPESVCRASADPCDPAESCSGDGAECPPDVVDDCDPDAGSGADAGSRTDAGSGDLDAGSGEPDSGPSDAGSSTVTYGSCGCRTFDISRDPVELPLISLVAGILLRRRRGS